MLWVRSAQQYRAGFNYNLKENRQGIMFEDCLEVFVRRFWYRGILEALRLIAAW